MAQSFDVVVIGGGPGGYVAAIRAAQLGLKTACIDDWKTPDGKPALGGTCTNIGCIPSKALLQSSENFEQAGHGFAEHGVRVKGLELDLAQMLKRKDQVVKASNDGVVYLFKKNKVAFFHGRGSFVKAGTEGCEIAVGEETLSARNVIIATGSSPRALSGAAFDEKLILSNDGALAIPEVPKRLGVIGAGVIGLEMGSVWRRLGSEVTILEALPVFLGAADEQIAREAWKIFTKQGLKIELGVKITGVKAKKEVTVEYADAEALRHLGNGERPVVAEDQLLVECRARQRARHRSGRDDHVLRSQSLVLCAGNRDLASVRARLGEAAAAVKERDLVLLEKVHHAVVAGLHHPVFALEHLRKVELKALHAHAVLGKAVPRLLEVLR